MGEGLKKVVIPAKAGIQELSEGFMSFIITDQCIACGTCKEECPSEAIIAEGGKYKITDACIECATCMETCPSGAIVED